MFLSVAATAVAMAAAAAEATAAPPSAAPAPPRDPRDRPNILLLLVDDLGYGDLGFTGHPTTRTPRLDALAAGGLRLTSWYSAYPVCTSSRTAVMTGRLPPRVGMPGVINSLSAAGLPLNETTLADVLRARGYATMAVGKWHLGQTPPYLPRRRGFDAFLGLPFSVDDGVGVVSPCGSAEHVAGHGGSFNSNSPFADGAFVTGSTGTGSAGGGGVPPQERLGLGPSLPLPLIRQQGNASEIVEQPTDLTLLTERLFNFTAAFATEHASGPMLLYVAFGHVHTATPNINPPLKQYSGCRFANTTRRGLFGDALAEVDAFAGHIADHLAALGVANNTLTLFVSDNGPSLRWGLGAGSLGLFTASSATFPSLTRPGSPGHCSDWVGGCYNDTGKGSTWEGGIRMPAFAHWPGVVRPRTVSAEVVSSLDVLPSAALLAGAALPPGVTLDGEDSLAQIVLDPTNAKSAHDVLWFYNEPQIANVSTRVFAARAGRYKLHFITSAGLGGGIFPDIGRPPVETTHDPPLVFDVEADPSESYPLSTAGGGPGAAVADAVSALKARFEAETRLGAIDPKFGFEWALCCGVGCPSAEKCVCHCPGPVPLPP